MIFAGSLPRGMTPTSTPGLIRELRQLGLVVVVDTDGDPLRHAVRAAPNVVSPNVLEAEELVGHEFNDDEDRVIAVREMVALGARRGDHDRARRLLRVGHARRRARRSTASASSHARRSRRSAPATRSSRATSPRATRASPPASACASASPAARSRCSAWARASSIRTRSIACSARSRSSACRRRPSRRLTRTPRGVGLPVPRDACRPHRRPVRALAGYASQDQDIATLVRISPVRDDEALG